MCNPPHPPTPTPASTCKAVGSGCCGSGCGSSYCQLGTGWRSWRRTEGGSGCRCWGNRAGAAGTLGPSGRRAAGCCGSDSGPRRAGGGCAEPAAPPAGCAAQTLVLLSAAKTQRRQQLELRFPATAGWSRASLGRRMESTASRAPGKVEERFCTSWMIFCSSLFSRSSCLDFSSSLLLVEEPVFSVSCCSDCHSPRVMRRRIWPAAKTTKTSKSKSAPKNCSHAGKRLHAGSRTVFFPRNTRTFSFEVS